MDFDGATVKILPDLSRATLHRRALLRPVLNMARQLGATYRWGFPLSVTFRREQRSPTLCMPGDLPAFFLFMDLKPIPVPNWLQLLPQLTNRPGSAAPWRNAQPRPRRAEQRSRRLSPVGPRPTVLTATAHCKPSY